MSVAIKYPIYLDHNATTPTDPRVLNEMLPYFSTIFGNPASIDHTHGLLAQKAVSLARKKVAALIGAHEDEIIFTSGATESDNLAIRGITDASKEKGNHIITCVTEHKAVLDTCKYLEKNGTKVTYLPVDRTGIVDLDKLVETITKNTVLISVMAANNEIGTIAPLKEIGKIAADYNIPFHTDAAQAAGHIPLNVEELGINVMSISAHKMYGSKGIGALYVRRNVNRIKISPILFGGGHEHGIRSGTLNVPGIVGIGKACEIAKKEMLREGERLRLLRDKMVAAFKKEFPQVELNGHPTQRLPNNLNISFPGVESKAIINSVKEYLSISAGSACTTTVVEPSYVINALGFGRERAFSSIRIGLGKTNTDEEVSTAVEIIVRAIRGDTN